MRVEPLRTYSFYLQNWPQRGSCNRFSLKFSRGQNISFLTIKWPILIESPSNLALLFILILQREWVNNFWKNHISVYFTDRNWPKFRFLLRYNDRHITISTEGRNWLNMFFVNPMFNLSLSFYFSITIAINTIQKINKFTITYHQLINHKTIHKNKHIIPLLSRGPLKTSRKRFTNKRTLLIINHNGVQTQPYRRQQYIEKKNNLWKDLISQTTILGNI